MSNGVPKNFILVNRTFRNYLIIELNEDYGMTKLEVRDCCGTILRIKDIELQKGMHKIDIPSAEVAYIGTNKE